MSTPGGGPVRPALSLAKMRPTDIERIEERREMNPTMDAIYLVSPQSHIVDCLVADLESRRYKKSFLVWTGVLEPALRRRIDGSPLAQKLIGGFETLSIDFFPRESHVITFRDPWSFPVLYHPACNALVATHMRILAQKVGDGLSLNHRPRTFFIC
jgi:syntaxin-binding protein 1